MTPSRQHHLHWAVVLFALAAPLALRAQTPLGVAPVPAAVPAEQMAAKEQAQTAALAWLALADSGKYPECWQTSADYFRTNVPQERWLAMIQVNRPPLGDVVSRKLINTTFTTTLTGAPVGQYVVIQYQTEFAHRKSAVETVTPMRQADGSWKVSGYYVR